MCLRGITGRRSAEAGARQRLVNKEDAEVARMWEEVYKSQAQRAHEEEDNSLVARRGNYELRRDMIIEGMVAGFAALLAIWVAISLAMQPDLIPGTILFSALLSTLRSLSSAARRRE